jgi:hypothetical protein
MDAPERPWYPGQPPRENTSSTSTRPASA